MGSYALRRVRSRVRTRARFAQQSCSKLLKVRSPDPLRKKQRVGLDLKASSHPRIRILRPVEPSPAGPPLLPPFHVLGAAPRLKWLRSVRHSRGPGLGRNQKQGAGLRPRPVREDLHGDERSCR